MKLLLLDKLSFTFRNISSDCTFGALPGIGNPALCSLMKYFCTRLQTCLVVWFPTTIKC